MSELTFRITNLNCEACVKLSTKALLKMPGVTEASVDLPTGNARVVSNGPLNPSDVTALLDEKGFVAAF